MGLRSIKVKGMIMKDMNIKEEIRRLDGNRVCTLDVLARTIGETHRCRECICKDTVSMGTCPIRLTGEFLEVG